MMGDKPLLNKLYDLERSIGLNVIDRDAQGVHYNNIQIDSLHRIFERYGDHSLALNFERQVMTDLDGQTHYLGFYLKTEYHKGDYVHEPVDDLDVHFYIVRFIIDIGIHLSADKAGWYYSPDVANRACDLWNEYCTEASRKEM